MYLFSMFEVIAAGLMIALSIFGAGFIIKRQIPKIDIDKSMNDFKGFFNIEWILTEVGKMIDAKYEFIKKDALDYLDASLPGISEQFASDLRENLQKSFGGMLSGMNRLDEGLAKAISTDLLNSNPLGQFIGQAARKYLGMKPQAIASLLQNPMFLNLIKDKIPQLSQLAGDQSQELNSIPPK